MGAGIVPTRVLVDSGACAVAGPGRDGRGSGRTDAQGNDNGSHEQGNAREDREHAVIESPVRV